MGAAVEFLPRGRFPPVTDMTGGGKFRLNKGEWTDDTAMALCLADSLIECNGFDPLDQMHRYWRWGNEGYNSTRPYAFGVGKTVANAMARFRKTGDPYSGSIDPTQSGNGSLMRLAPIPMFFFNRPDQVITFAALSSKTTHGSAECLACCQYFSIVLLRALGGELEKDRLFPTRLDFEAPESFRRIAEQRFRHSSVTEIAGSGYVIESLEAALWCFWHTESFEHAILAATNLGDDADTTAAICGQLAGAYYGSSHIPKTWTQRLYGRENICRIGRQLAGLAELNAELSP